jgi:hypothetical protein
MERAASSDLANVRTIATKAANIWRLEGIDAEKRERRAAAGQAQRALGEAHSVLSDFQIDGRHHSENPDRGLAAA